jgi:hypothetical protein
MIRPEDAAGVRCGGDGAPATIARVCFVTPLTAAVLLEVNRGAAPTRASTPDAFTPCDWRSGDICLPGPKPECWQPFFCSVAATGRDADADAGIRGRRALAVSAGPDCSTCFGVCRWAVGVSGRGICGATPFFAFARKTGGPGCGRPTVGAAGLYLAGAGFLSCGADPAPCID